MIAQILVGVLAGVFLADHYKTDRLKTILASIVLGFINVWIYLHLTVRKGWGVGKTVGVMIGGYFLIFWLFFTLALIANAGVVRG